MRLAIRYKINQIPYFEGEHILIYKEYIIIIKL